jgi:aryl-alcohol dehydrogenase-like predicted oxidoreductase
MRYRSLGDSGLLVSVVGLGGNNFGGRLDVPRTRAVADAAMDAGITLIDTSDTYGNGGGSEGMLGEVLAGRRDQVVLATKFGHQRVDMGYGPAAGAKGSRAYIRRAVEASLRRLRTDYLDLYQLHTPDPVTPIEETLRALSELVSEGKVRYLGHSNLSGWQAADAPTWRGRPAPSPSSPRRTTGRCWSGRPRRSWCPRPASSGSAFCPTSRWPTACSLARSGAVRNRRRAAGWPAGRATSLTPSWTGVEALAEWAAGHGVSLLDVAIGTLAAQPGCASVIAGATAPDQVKANAAAADWIPAPADLAELDKVVPPPEPAS